jgi:hypothetical protein
MTDVPLVIERPKQQAWALATKNSAQDKNGSIKGTGLIGSFLPFIVEMGYYKNCDKAKNAGAVIVNSLYIDLPKKQRKK